MSFELSGDWLEDAHACAFIAASAPWMLGRLLEDAPTQDDLTELLQAFPTLEPGDTASYRFVHQRIPEDRRRMGLSWAKHAAVADLPDGIADRLLGDASEFGWSLIELSAAAAGERKTGEGEPRAAFAHIFDD